MTSWLFYQIFSHRWVTSIFLAMGARSSAIITKSTPASFSFIGQVTKHTTVKRSIKVDCLSRRFMRLVPVFILDEFNRRRKKYLPKFVPEEYD